MLFEWDAEKAAVNLKKHGVRFQTAVLVFYDENRIEMYDSEHSQDEDRYNTIGMVNDMLFYEPSPDLLPCKHLTREQIAEIEAHAPRDEEIVYDADCPPMSDEQLRMFKRVHPRPALAEPAEKFV